MPHFRPPPNCYRNDSQSETNDGETQEGSQEQSSGASKNRSDGVHHNWYHHNWDSWFNFGHKSGSHDIPISCEDKAKERIRLKHATCEQAANMRGNQCARLNHLRHCDEMTRQRTIRWNKKCGINLPLPKPRLGMPMNCAGDSDISCSKKASQKVKTQLKECLDKTKTMRFINACGLLQYKNNCYLESLTSQIALSKECHFNWVEIALTFEFSSECIMENCLQTGKNLIGKINDSCRESVANSKMNECAKARSINSCLQDYEFVPKFFNRTCREKMLLMLGYEDESAVCVKNDTIEVAVTNQ